MDTNPQAYSRRVALLKKLLPALAVCGLVALILGANPDILRRLAQDAPNALSGDLSIQSPKFEGRLDNGLLYVLQASLGRQGENGSVILRDMQLRLSGADNALSAEAKSGIMMRGNRAARFIDNVIVTDKSGNRLETAVLDFDRISGTIKAPNPIIMTGPTGTVSAQAMMADGKGEVYRFDKIQMRLRRSAP